jgi:hypothetical protein
VERILGGRRADRKTLLAVKPACKVFTLTRRRGAATLKLSARLTCHKLEVKGNSVILQTRSGKGTWKTKARCPAGTATTLTFKSALRLQLRWKFPGARGLESSTSPAFTVVVR